MLSRSPNSGVQLGNPWQARTLSSARFGSAVGAVAQANTLGTTEGESDLLREIVYLDTDPSSPADKTASLQAFLNHCHLIARSMKNTIFDDLFHRQYVRAVLPMGKYYLTSPLVIPEYVRLDCRGIIVRNCDGTTAGTTSWTGDPTAKALNNVYQPAVIGGPKSGIQEINLYCNNDGIAAHGGSGIVMGKTWDIAGASPVAGGGGSGYVVGDVLHGVLPSIKPLASFAVAVSAIGAGGTVTAVTLQSSGVYPLPPYIQQQIWTAAHGYSVFVNDGSGHYLTTGGTGTGCTLSVTWNSDFSPFIVYYGGPPVIGDTYLGVVRVVRAGLNYDATTCGPCFGVMHVGLNHEADALQIGSGYYGYLAQGANDIRLGRLNCVLSQTGLALIGSSSVECPNVVLDSCLTTSIVVTQSAIVALRGKMFMAPSNAAIYTSSPSSYPVVLGLPNNPTDFNFDITVEFDCLYTGTVGKSVKPIAYLSNTYGSRVCLRSPNATQAGLTAAGNAYFHTHWAEIGPGWDNSNLLEGSIVNVAGPLFVGYPLGSTGSFTFSNPGSNNDTVTINGVTITLKASAPTGAQILIGAHSADTEANLVAYINANSATLGVTATSSGFVVSLASYVAGAAGTSIAIAASSTSIAVSGAHLVAGQIAPSCGINIFDHAASTYCGMAGRYALSGNGSPTSSTGQGKTPGGSTYWDSAGAQTYVNTATEAAPSWKQLTRAA